METSHTHVVCAHCGAKNRIASARLRDEPVCGRCGQGLLDGHPVELTDANFDAVAQGTELPLVVDFWAPWCGPCIQLGPVIDEIADAKVGSAKVAKVNVDENFQTAGQYRINSIPALLFFKGGQVRDQLVGRVPKADILAKLEALV